jgi:hypothetical protein
MNKTLSIVIPIAAIATAAVFVGQFMSLVLTPQEVYAPTGRRGYFCEFRPEAQLEAAYPVQAEIMAQTIAAQNGIGMLYMH